MEQLRTAHNITTLASPLSMAVVHLALPVLLVAGAVGAGIISLSGETDCRRDQMTHTAHPPSTATQ